MKPGEGTRRRPGSFHDREATEEALRSAAVGLLHRDLAGLNLREVADAPSLPALAPL
ncbi:MAG: hypothetical protein JWN00_3868 [Actinomycetia bacterium]|nr:hypothetical protein [Actinomycetes bacterium]